MKSEFIDRRSFLGRGAMATAGLFAGGSFSRVVAQDARGLPTTAAVATTAGKVRGLVRYGVNQFWGVPYGASTAGANRFMPPVKPAAWTGVRDAFQVEPAGAAGSRRSDLGSVVAGSARADGRRLPEHQRLHAGSGQRQPAGDGVAARRRVRRRIRQLAALRRDEPRPQRGRGRRVGESPAQPVRFPASRRIWRRREMGQLQQRRHAGHRRRAGDGSRTTSPRSAAIPATSPSSASPAAAAR